MRAALALAAFAALAAPWPALAHDSKVGNIVVSQPWARATTAKVGGAYLTLRNTGRAADRLLKIVSPAAAAVEIHETRIEGGSASMRRVDRLEIKPGARVELRPGGMHLMLMGLEKPLKEGERVKLVLSFDVAGSVEVEATIEKAGAAKPAHKD
jgi:hypothetical protein